MTICEQLKKEEERVGEILERNKVSKEDTKELMLTIQDIYFKWWQASTTSRALEAIIKEYTKLDDNKISQIFLCKLAKEEAKFPFECRELDEETLEKENEDSEVI